MDLLTLINSANIWFEDYAEGSGETLATIEYRDNPSFSRLLDKVRSSGITKCLVTIVPPDDSMAWHKCRQYEEHLKDFLNVEDVQFYIENAPSKEGLGSQLSVHRIMDDSEIQSCFNLWNAYQAREGVIELVNGCSCEFTAAQALAKLFKERRGILRPVPPGMYLEGQSEFFLKLVRISLKAAEAAEISVLMDEENWSWVRQTQG